MGGSEGGGRKEEGSRKEERGGGGRGRGREGRIMGWSEQEQV